MITAEAGATEEDAAVKLEMVLEMVMEGGEE